MTTQHYLFYSDDDHGPCVIDWYPCLLQLAPGWFRGNGKGGRIETGSYSWHREGTPPTYVYRDDLRKGWHVVPEVVRYVAVKGIVAGQRCLVATSMEAVARGLIAPLHEHNDKSRYCWAVARSSTEDKWTVLDLHDLGDHRDKHVWQRDCAYRRHVCTCGNEWEDTQPIGTFANQACNEAFAKDVLGSLSSSIGTRTDLTIDDVREALRKLSTCAGYAATRSRRQRTP